MRCPRGAAMNPPRLEPGLQLRSVRVGQTGQWGPANARRVLPRRAAEVPSGFPRLPARPSPFRHHGAAPDAAPSSRTSQLANRPRRFSSRRVFVCGLRQRSDEAEVYAVVKCRARSLRPAPASLANWAGACHAAPWRSPGARGARLASQWPWGRSQPSNRVVPSMYYRVCTCPLLRVDQRHASQPHQPWAAGWATANMRLRLWPPALMMTP